MDNALTEDYNRLTAERDALKAENDRLRAELKAGFKAFDKGLDGHITQLRELREAAEAVLSELEGVDIPFSSHRVLHEMRAVLAKLPG